jgi:hypothetical protein
MTAKPFPAICVTIADLLRNTGAPTSAPIQPTTASPNCHLCRGTETVATRCGAMRCPICFPARKRP